LRISVVLSILFAAPAVLAAADSTPPPARTVDSVDRNFGIVLPDPYRWMEGEKNAEFAGWLKAQGEFGRRKLDATPRLAFWRERLGAAAGAVTINRLQTPMGGRIFFLRLQGGGEGTLMVRDRDGRERTLLIPAADASGKGTAAITDFAPSPDGNRIAVNVQSGGSEITHISVIDVGSAKALADRTEDVWGELPASWLPDGSGYFYTQLAPAAVRDVSDFTLNQRVLLHRLGAARESDTVLIARGAKPEAQLDPHEFPFLSVIENSHFGVLQIGGARPESRVCVAPRTQAVAANAKWNCIIGYGDNVQQTALHGDVLYIAAMRGTPNGRLLKLDLSKSQDLRQATMVLPESADGVLSGLAAAGDALYVRRMQGGPDSLLRVKYSGAVEPIPLPFVGAIYQLATDPRAPGLVFTLQGWTVPRIALRFSGAATALEDLRLGAAAAADYSNLVAEETTAKSLDGTWVPLSIIHRKDSSPDHTAAAVLDGYGGYGISEQPFFDPLMLEWVEAGHVFAVAHVRGGGEKGDRWRLTGSGAFKERGIEDFIACAQTLESKGWAKRGQVVGFGGSMGGVLVGGAITRAPDAFGAAIIQAGELNPSRLIAAANGANQFAEVGDPRTSQGLHMVAAMDPYQRIKDGAPYPAVLLIVGLNDHRVSPWASGKFGARLAAATHNHRPVLFRTDGDMGHFNTAASAQALELSDAFAFAEMALASH
jgi:prolyl oligopeptidase